MVIVPMVNTISSSRSTTRETYCHATRFDVRRSSLFSRRSPRSSVSETRDRVLTRRRSSCPVPPQPYDDDFPTWRRNLFPVPVSPLPRVSDSDWSEEAVGMWQSAVTSVWKSCRMMSSEELVMTSLGLRWHSYNTRTDYAKETLLAYPIMCDQ